MSWKIPYFDLVLGEEEKQAAISVINSNWLTTGPRISEFEAQFASSMCNPQVKAIAVSNCTSAMHLALLALGIQSGDEVICPSLTFVATANVIRYTGATPVFADVCSDAEWNISPDDIEAKITDKTRAIMVMHYAGYPCRMEKIREIADKRGLSIVEDVAHGPLAEWKGKKLGTWGDVGCFSFFSNKNMTTGEGGMVITQSATLAEKIKAMRSHGLTSTTYERFKGHAFGYDVTLLGYNYRLDEIRAAIGIEQLKKLPACNSRRKHLVEYYRTAVVARVPEVSVPFRDWNGNYSYHVFPVLLPNGYANRNGLMTQMARQGIQTSIHYRPVHTFSAYPQFSTSLPITDAIAPRILSLPLYPTLEEADIDAVINALKFGLA